MKRAADAHRAIYIAGPMTGKPELNHAAFEAAKLAWERTGHYAVTPFELNIRVWHKWLGGSVGDPTIEQLTALPYGHPMVNDFLLADLDFIAHTADAIAVLPGFEHSRGTKIEILAARTFGKPVFDAMTQQPLDVQAAVELTLADADGQGRLAL